VSSASLGSSSTSRMVLGSVFSRAFEVVGTFYWMLPLFSPKGAKKTSEPYSIAAKALTRLEPGSGAWSRNRRLCNMHENLPSIRAICNWRQLGGPLWLCVRDMMALPGGVRRERVHLGTTTGPRAVLGSQRPGIAESVQVYFTLPAHSNALRAQDGSRSVLSGRSLAVVPVARCTRRAMLQ
jgi:hypothetical protein